MTIHIEVSKNLVDVFGSEIAEIQRLIDVIDSELRDLSNRASGLEELHAELLHAEAEALEEKAEEAAFLEIREAEEKLRKLKEDYGR